MADAEGPYGQVGDGGGRRKSTRKVSKNTRIGEGVRILTDDDRRRLDQLRFRGPDWDNYKHELAKFVTMDASCPMIEVVEVTAEMRKREWLKHREYNNKRVVADVPETSQLEQQQLQTQLAADMAFFRQELLRQSTPLMALNGAFEEVLTIASQSLGIEKRQMTANPVVLAKLDAGLSDIIMVQMLRALGERYKVSNSDMEHLLAKHIFQLEQQ